MSPIISLTIMATRQCGECKECCVVLPILDEELSKPGHQPCKHLCGCGCDIYKERPGVCRDYECLWLSGDIDGDQRTRPDNLGVIFQRSTWDDSLAAIGCRPGALATPQAQDVISRLR